VDTNRWHVRRSSKIAITSGVRRLLAIIARSLLPDRLIRKRAR
jgi:hypothetical protein